MNSFLENVILWHNYRINYERVLLLKSQTFWEVVAENMGQEWEELVCKGSGLGHEEEWCESELEQHCNDVERNDRNCRELEWIPGRRGRRNYAGHSTESTGSSLTILCKYERQKNE